jgi:hypothetical protein
LYCQLVASAKLCEVVQSLGFTLVNHLDNISAVWINKVSDKQVVTIDCDIRTNAYTKHSTPEHCTIHAARTKFGCIAMENNIPFGPEASKYTFSNMPTPICTGSVIGSFVRLSHTLEVCIAPW